MSSFEKYEVLKTLTDSKIVAVIRGNSSKEAIETVEACVEGGIKAIEVTYTIRTASEVISYFAENRNTIVGAGTVLDAETARMAIQTVTEILTALEAGCDLIKLFPGNNFDHSYMKAVKAPVPKVKFMVTGGVNVDNIAEWLKAGANAVGVGGNLVKGSKEDIIKAAKEYLAKIKE